MEPENKSKTKVILASLSSLKNENSLNLSEKIMKQLDNLIEALDEENLEKDQIFELIGILKKIIFNLTIEVKKSETVSEFVIKNLQDHASQLASKIKREFEIIEKSNNEEKLIFTEKIDNLSKEIKELTKEHKTMKQEIENNKINLNELAKEQKTMKQEIENNKINLNELKQEIENNKKNINELKEEIENNKKNLNELKEEQKTMKQEIKKINLKIDKMIEEKNLIIQENTQNKIEKEELKMPKIIKGNLEIEKEILETKLKEGENKNNKIDKENEDKSITIQYLIDKFKETDEKFEKLNKEVERMKKTIFGIKNRDNYKSIIYILLIYYGFDFKEIDVSFYYLINDEKIKNKEIKKILKDAFHALLFHKGFDKEAYTEEIMKKLFPQSKIIIEDDLINNMRNLLIRYQNNKFINDIKDEKQIESDIEELSKKIKELKLNVEETI